MPGLTNGLLALDYVPPLAAALDTLGYSLVQPVLSSSYKGERGSHPVLGSTRAACPVDVLSYTPCPGLVPVREFCLLFCFYGKLDGNALPWLSSMRSFGNAFAVSGLLVV